jgi:hypothetical protein
MKAATKDEAGKWCSQEAVGLRFTREGLLTYGGTAHKFFITAPEEHREILVLARHILLFGGEADFNGGLFWLQRWSIGSPQLVRVGWRILEDIRRAHGELRSLETAPAQFFREDELVELHAFLIQAIAFGWLADFIPSGAGFFVHFKTNRQICFTARSAEKLKELRAAFQEWHPTDEDPMVAKMALIAKSRKAS